MQDHRLGFPAVLAAILDPEPRRSMFTPRRGRMSQEEEAERFAKDLDETHDLPAPPMALRYSEPAYQPEGFDFAYVDRKGHQVDVIPQREAAKVTLADVDDAQEAACKRVGWDAVAQFAIDFLALAGIDVGACLPESHYAAFIEGLNDLEPKAAAPAAPTEWQDGAPPCAGWYVSRRTDWMNQPLARYWAGTGWGIYVNETDPIGERRRCMEQSGPRDTPIQWRGPRLTGPDWPEPEMSADTLKSICDKWQADNAHIDTDDLFSIIKGIARKYGADAPIGLPSDKRAAFAAELQGTVPAQSVPSIADCMAAYFDGGTLGRCVQAIRDAGFQGTGYARDFIPTIPPHKRAAFIAACRAHG